MIEFQNLRFAVLMGGPAKEREISIKSGQAVANALQNSGFNVQAYDVQNLDDVYQLKDKVDLVFLALHGRWGEDGSIQAILENLQIPYTGSGVSASAIGMDKLRTKWLWSGAGLATPKFEWISSAHPLNEALFDLKFPVMVKPIKEGSSIGMRKVYSFDDLTEAVAFAQGFDDEVLVEQWVTGREFTAGVLGDQVLPLIELKTTHDFYDFDAKYQANDTQYICPVDLDPDQQVMLENLVSKAFSSVGCRGWGRVDFMLDEAGQPWLIEVNTCPGMTDHSLMPMAAKQHGLSFEQLVESILKLSARHFSLL